MLGPFTLMDALGTGSMGTVYKAQSKTDNQWYAVKVLPRRSMWNVRIARRKVRSFEQCQHPAVVPFVDVGTAGGMHYLAWPLVEGTTLDKMVEETGQAAARAGRPCTSSQAAEGLDLCHQQGLFHGLLKPSNLMIGTDGQVRILDFGIGCSAGRDRGRIAGGHHVDGQLGEQRPGLRQPRKHHGPDEPDAGRRSVQPRLRAVLPADRAATRSRTERRSRR